MNCVRDAPDEFARLLADGEGFLSGSFLTEWEEDWSPTLLFYCNTHSEARKSPNSVQNRSADSAAAESSLLTVWTQEVTQVQTEHKPEDKDSQNLCLKGETGPSTSFNVTSFLEVLWRDSSPSVFPVFSLRTFSVNLQDCVLMSCGGDLQSHCGAIICLHVWSDQILKIHIIQQFSRC